MCVTEILGAVVGKAISGGGGSSTPATTTYTPPPSAKDYTGSDEVTSAVKKTRAKLAAASGMQSTIKTGAQGDTSAATTAKKTALGL